MPAPPWRTIPVPHGARDPPIPCRRPVLAVPRVTLCPCHTPGPCRPSGRPLAPWGTLHAPLPPQPQPPSAAVPPYVGGGRPPPPPPWPCLPCHLGLWCSPTTAVFMSLLLAGVYRSRLEHALQHAQHCVIRLFLACTAHTPRVCISVSFVGTRETLHCAPQGNISHCICPHLQHGADGGCSGQMPSPCCLS